MSNINSAAALFTVFSAWQSNSLSTLNQLHQSAETEAEATAYANAIAVIEDSPVVATFATNHEVVNREFYIEVENEEVSSEDQAQADTPDVDESMYAGDEPDTCDCPACQLRRSLQDGSTSVGELSPMVVLLKMLAAKQRYDSLK